MGKATYFISDLHLGATYLNDEIECERRVVRWLDGIKDNAKALYLMGDILDYWYEYKYVVPKGFVRFLGKLAELSDMGIEIYWFIGNHDIWLFDYFPKEFGIKVIDGYEVKDIDGKKFFLSHGDGVGKRGFGFRFIRGLFRNKFCQWLYAGIHPRWTIPFAHNCSTSSRKSSWKDNKEEEAVRKGMIALEEFSLDYLNEHEHIDYFIYGHLHRVVNKEIKPDSNFIVLGDWISRFSYGGYKDGKFEMKTFVE